ncbi:MAG: septal ring lytic transglycosylase RlpA family protein [Proteobacteria bacterium]|nr:septal ring lytic transglycosylase RlpA family protein [Pseudomonadota bacterium]
MKRIVLVALACLILVSCGSTRTTPGKASLSSGDGGHYKVGSPYTVRGVRYVPREDTRYDERGIASWYGPKFHGRRTANGEIFDMYQVSAAHKTLPMPIMVRVTNLDNGKSLVARLNDRGPYVSSRIIDMSYRAAQLLDFVERGTARVRVQYFGPAPVGGGGSAAVETTRIPVEQGPVTNSAIFVQAGSFSDRNNAQRLKKELSSIGKTEVMVVSVNGRTFYRVRIGPLRTVSDADAILERVIRAGHRDARIRVDVAG